MALCLCLIYDKIYWPHHEPQLILPNPAHRILVYDHGTNGKKRLIIFFRAKWFVNLSMVWLFEIPEHNGYPNNLCHSICELFVYKEYMARVILDIDKTYDMIWRHRILMKHLAYCFRGNLPLFISSFLQNLLHEVTLLCSIWRFRPWELSASGESSFHNFILYYDWWYWTSNAHFTQVTLWYGTRLHMLNFRIHEFISCLAFSKSGPQDSNSYFPLKSVSVLCSIFVKYPH